MNAPHLRRVRELLDLTLADATTNVVTDMISMDHTTSGTVAAGFGSGIRFDLEDAGGSEEQASIDASLSTVTDGSEDADIIFRQNSVGGIVETVRIVGTQSATASSLLRMTGTTTETDGVVDVLEILLNTGTPAAGFGAGISFQLEDAGGNEEQASIDVIMDDPADGIEDVSMAFNIQRNGTIKHLELFC